MTTRAAQEWRGVFPSLCTPFHNDTVDIAGMRAVTRFALDAGAAGIVLHGVAGEVDKLSERERGELTEAVVSVVDGRVPILVGGTGASIAESRRLGAKAEALGAAGIILPAPPQRPLSDEHLADFFATVAAAVAVPVLIQDAPEYVGTSVSPSVVRAARRAAPNISGVKVEVGPEGIEWWRSELGEDSVVFCGDGGLYMLDALHAGASGVMPGVDLTDRLVAVWNMRVDGDSAVAESGFRELLPMLVYEMQSMTHYNCCAKEVLIRRGVALASSELRGPGQRSLGMSARARIESYMVALRLLPNTIGQDGRVDELPPLTGPS